MEMKITENVDKVFMVNRSGGLSFEFCCDLLDSKQVDSKIKAVKETLDKLRTLETIKV